LSQVTVLIPAYNEETRLPETLQALWDYIQKTQTEFQIVQVLVVDDGSEDKTLGTVQRFAQQWPLLKTISLSRNRGKGAAVHAGLGICVGDWVLIADADMATPWEELQKLWSHREGAGLVMGSRGLPESQIEVPQHWVRQSLGRTFNRFLRLVSGLPYYDTQCGFKLLRRNELFVQQTLPLLKVQRFAWDVELILELRSSGVSIKEIPIRWQHREFSKVRLVSDSLEMLWTVLKLKLRGHFRL
jgi:dolichyl-phosphate beta-glucosyltransferase